MTTSRPATPTDPLANQVSPVLTWHLVKRQIEQRIASGTSQVGSYLPSVRALALELGVNRNTVSKVYQELGRERVVEVVPGLGVRVMASVEATPVGQTSVTQLTAELARLVASKGMARETVLATLDQQILREYARRRLSVGFLECDPSNVRRVCQDLATELGQPVTPLYLNQLERRPEVYPSHCRIVGTTLPHLHRVIELLEPRGIDVVAIHHLVPYDALTRIAMSKERSRVAIVCAHQETIEAVMRNVALYTTNAEIHPALASDVRAVKQAVMEADLVVDTLASHRVVSRLAPLIPTETVRLYIDPRSVAHLRSVVDERAGIADAQEAGAILDEDGGLGPRLSGGGSRVARS